MKRLVFALLALQLLAPLGAAWAQNPKAKAEPSITASSHELKSTPEMWFYEQENRRYADPQNAVRRNAELAFAQRQQRLAAMKWFGYSSSRPTVNPTPFGSPYSPTWANSGIRNGSWASQRQLYVVPSAK